MPGREHGAGLSSYVLVLREHDDGRRGYSLELAPLLGGGASPRAHGRGSTEEGETAAGMRPLAHGGVLTREAAGGTRTAPRAHQRSSSAEAAGAGSRAHGGSPTREAATGTGAGTGSRGLVSSPTREAETGRQPRARGHRTAVEVGTGTPSHTHGGRAWIGAAGGAGSGVWGDAAAGGADLVEEYDPAGAAREKILRDMRERIFSSGQSGVTLTPEHTEFMNGSDSKNVREVLIPVFLSPKKKGKDVKEDDEIWNKRQISYIFVLTTTAGLVFLLQPLLPAAFGRWIIMIIAAGWGAGSIDLPCGLHGTARCEKECSRHVGRLVYTLFSVLVIYGFYLAAMRIDDTPVPTPSPALMEGDHTYAIGNGEFWAFWFGLIGLSVFVGNIWSSIRGCWTGGDRDP